MPAHASLHEALELFGKLSARDQELMLEIARKRRIEEWRIELAAYALKTRRDHRAGKLKAVSRKELPGYLDRLWKEENA